MTVYIISEERGRAISDAKWRDWPAVGGIELVTLTSECHDRIRLATASPFLK